MSLGSIFIGNLDTQLKVEQVEAEVYELATQCGPVRSIRVPSEDGKSKGFAFVEMGDSASALYATLALNGLILNEKTLRCACAMENEKDILLKLDSSTFYEDEIDLYEAISDQFGKVVGISISRRYQYGKPECKASIWFADKSMKKEAYDSFSRECRYLNGVKFLLQ